MKQISIFGSCTVKIILANLIVFILFSIATFFVDINVLLSYFALQPSSLIHGQRIWTLFTSMFLHVEFWHLFVNMFSLYFIGTFVENLIGKKRFLIFYILSGIFAGLFWGFLSGFFAINVLLSNLFGNSMIYGVGASGAIFGLVGILAVLTPRAKVFLIAGPIIAIILETIVVGIFSSRGLLEVAPYSTIISLVEIAITIYFIIAIFSIISFNPYIRKIGLPIELPMWALPIVAIVPLMILSLFVTFPIGNTAHLGGLIAGLIYAYYLKRKFPNKSRMISRMFR